MDKNSMNDPMSLLKYERIGTCGTNRHTQALWKGANWLRLEALNICCRGNVVYKIICLNCHLFFTTEALSIAIHEHLMN